MGEKKMIQKNYYKPFQQKCNNTKCDKPALTENKINVGNRTLYYCNKHFQEIRSDLKRPTGYPKDHKTYHPGMWPRPEYANPTPAPKKTWNQPKTTRQNNTRNKMPTWEQIQVGKKKKKGTK